jgi:cell division protein FtsX
MPGELLVNKDDISLPFVALLIPVGFFLIIYMIRGAIKGSINRSSISQEPCNRNEEPFLFWAYVIGGLLMGLLLIIYAVFSLLERWK